MSDKLKSANIVFDDDGVTVLSAFKRVWQMVDDGDGNQVMLRERDVDLDGKEVQAMFGATIDAHLTQTNARAAAAEAQVTALTTEKTDLEKQLQEATDAKATAEAAYAQLLSEMEPLQ